MKTPLFQGLSKNKASGCQGKKAIDRVPGEAVRRGFAFEGIVLKG
jgi:hypothetical protein